jgi:hypothetical protein
MSTGLLQEVYLCDKLNGKLKVWVELTDQAELGDTGVVEIRVEFSKDGQDYFYTEDVPFIVEGPPPSP